MKVNFIIAGGQKCGTTALHSFLSMHPEVKSSNPKEIDFFNYDYNYSKGIGFYHSFFPDRKLLDSFIGKKFLEASPTYLSDENIKKTAKRIHDYNRNMKVIILVRNPADRAFSAWNMYKRRHENGMTDWWFNWMKNRKGNIPVAIRRTEDEYNDFTLFLENEIAAISNNLKIECDVLRMGEYDKGLRIFKEVFKENLLVVKNEKFLSNTPETLKKIAEFLILKNFDWEKFRNKKVFSGNYQNIMEDSAKSILSEYYKRSNENLRKLTGIHYT